MVIPWSKYVDTLTVFQKMWPKGYWPQDELWPHFCWGHTCDPKAVEVTCVTLPKDHCVQVPWKYIKVSGYSDPFCKNLNQRPLTPRWPLTPHMLRSHVWLYPRIVVSKSHGNTSMYVDTVINFAKYHIHTRAYIIHTYYCVSQKERVRGNQRPYLKMCPPYLRFYFWFNMSTTLDSLCKNLLWIYWMVLKMWLWTWTQRKLRI